MPMIVRHRTMPHRRSASASHQPHSRNQMTLPIPEPTPASARLTTVLPNGQSANMAMRREAIPNGIVMIRMKQMSAATA